MKILWTFAAVLLVIGHSGYSPGTGAAVSTDGGDEAKIPRRNASDSSGVTRNGTVVTTSTKVPSLDDGTNDARGDAENEDEEDEDVDIDAILRPLGMPRCIDQCTKELRAQLGQMLHFNQTLAKLGAICKLYERAHKCAHEATLCVNVNLLDIVTSGIGSLCGDAKRQFMRKNAACLDLHMDKAGQDCEKKCHFRKTIAQFSHRSDLHDAGLLHLLDLLNHHSGPLCTSAGCFLECFRDQMNRACAHAGGVIMDGVLRPFYQLAHFVQKGGIAFRDFLDNKLPSECRYLTKKDTLDNLVNPNKT